ncbi:response regulator [Desulfovibrio inopinatus]|uniref:response regulator n=1 Tax=Desulfovibrio inopinatus TaxID=102109 RepID=UPI0003F73309|nr:response regulator [Desulfovibrio inopinatus]
MTSVLLVDDETRFRQVLVKRLSRRGFQVFEAANGADALKRMTKTPCEVVVLDVKMPDLDGLEVLRRIKDQFPYTAVILLSGHTSIEDGMKGMKAGAYDYLSKPVDLEELAKVIRLAHINQKNNISLS